MFFFNNKSTNEIYDMSKFMPFLTDNYDILDSYFIDKLVKLPMKGTYEITTQEHKMQTISFIIYGDTSYWWLLMMYNSILDTKELSTGKVLKFFSLSDLESLMFSLKSKSRAARL